MLSAKAAGRDLSARRPPTQNGAQLPQSAALCSLPPQNRQKRRRAQLQGHIVLCLAPICPASDPVPALGPVDRSRWQRPCWIFQCRRLCPGTSPGPPSRLRGLDKQHGHLRPRIPAVSARHAEGRAVLGALRHDPGFKVCGGGRLNEVPRANRRGCVRWKINCRPLTSARLHFHAKS